MVKRHEPNEPLLRFPTVDVTEVHRYSTAIADMYSGNLDGIIIRGVLPPDTVELVLGRLAAGEFDVEATKFQVVEHLPESPYTLGRPLAAIGEKDDSETYFRIADAFRQKCRELFRETHDYEQRVGHALGGIASGMPARVPGNPEGRTYTPATIRVLPPGRGFDIHVGSDFLVYPQYQHLANLVEANVQLSYFVPLMVPESGGELFVYALEWEDMAKHHASGASQREINEIVSSMMNSIECMAFTPGAGDLLIFNGGRYYHRVGAPIGARPRCTIGGFVGRARAKDAVYYWS